MKDSEIAFVILSCDKFKITWKPCVDHLFKSWPNCPYPVYLLNNFIPSNDERIIDLNIGKDYSWSDSLIKGLEKLEEERVFFIYDDTFITYFNSAEIVDLFSTVIKHNLDSVTLRKNPFGNGNKYSKKLYKISPKTIYRNALFLNLMRKDILLSLLKSGENAWQFEKVGNIRSINLNFYSVYKTDLVKYYHGILKGKWLPGTKKYLIGIGYALNDENFGVHSNLRIIGLNFYRLIFLASNKIIHLVKQLR